MNTSFRLAPFADVLYAMDLAWWDAYADEVKRSFSGLCINPWHPRGPSRPVKFDHSRNSGAGAISLAAHWGASRIIMLGYDCQHTGGVRHWHADHPAKLGNAGSVNQWPAIFRQLALRLGSLQIINASRETALRSFPRQSLAEALSC